MVTEWRTNLPVCVCVRVCVCVCVCVCLCVLVLSMITLLRQLIKRVAFVVITLSIKGGSAILDFLKNFLKLYTLITIIHNIYKLQKAWIYR